MAVDQVLLSQVQALNQNMSQLIQKTGTLNVLVSYTVTQATALTGVATGQMIYVTNETGGAVPAFYDGASFRRVTDRAIIS